MKDYGQIIAKIQDTPWMITPGGLRTILQIVESHISGSVSLEEIRQRTDGATRERGSIPKQSGTVGLLPLHGPIFPKANLMTELSGATSVEQWAQDFRALMMNERVESILLDIDSPGGSAFMIEEMANEIRAAREHKPIYAVANSMAASAAYYLGSQASELYVSDSGIVGSVGTYYVHTDESELEAKAGVKTTVIKEGRFKAALIEPLTAESHGHLQGMVKDMNDLFVQSVANGRNTTVEDVTQNYGEGGVVSAKKALETGMVDGVRTFDEVLTALLDGGGTLAESSSTSGNGTAVFSLRSSFDKEKEHAEPGTGLGGEPTPRENPDDEHVDEWKRGERLHRPPNIPELEEGALMNREALLAYAQRLGIKDAESLTDEELSTKVSAGIDANFDMVAEISEATEQAQQQVEFSKQFPEQAERLRKLEETNQAAASVQFANQLSSFQVTEGEGDEAQVVNFRLSSLAQEVVKDTHLKLAQGHLVQDDLKILIQTVAKGGVQQGEIGSSRSDDTDPGIVPTNRQDVRKMFAQKVADIMTEDKLDRKAAIAEASNRYPELASAYAQS